MQKFINKIALKAGKIALDYFHQDLQIEKKAQRELVTIADKKVEEFIRSRILKKFSGHQFVGEENEIINKENASHIWYVDPIDGTSNFVSGLPIWAVSIGYEKEGEMQNGAIYIPVLKELYYAEKGKGAFLNKKKISPSNNIDLIDVTASTGFACIRAGLQPNNLEIVNKIIPHLRGIRRIGSAAYDLACVASGKVDAFWEKNLSPWDIMAGKLIIEEAGGVITDFSGGNLLNEKREILTSNSRELHRKLLEFFTK